MASNVVVVPFQFVRKGATLVDEGLEGSDIRVNVLVFGIIVRLRLLFWSGCFEVLLGNICIIVPCRLLSRTSLMQREDISLTDPLLLNILTLALQKRALLVPVNLRPLRSLWTQIVKTFVFRLSGPGHCDII